MHPERSIVMGNQLELMASVYMDEEGAKTILDALQRMHRASNITLADAATVTKDADGRLHIKETREVTTGKGARRGALVAGVLGLIFPPSLIASALAGGLVGGAWGRLRDTGIKTGAMKDLGSSLEPGNAAVVALAEPQFVEPIVRAMEAYPGKFLRHGFSTEEAAQIEDAAAAGDANR
jgi:uncharacterized membrane protein